MRISAHGYVFPALALVLAAGACARLPRVVPVEEINEVNGDFMYYALPQTVLTVTTSGTVTKIDDKALCFGSDFDSARQELRLHKSKVKGKVFSLGTVTISSRFEANPDKVYAVKLNRAGTNAVRLQTDARGIPSSASASETDVVLPAITGGLGSVASLVSKAFGSATATASTPAPPETSTACTAAADQLNSVRDEIVALHASSGADDPKDVLEYKLAKLQVEAKRLESLFTGVTVAKPVEIVCEVRPDSQTSEYPLLTYTKAQGVTSHACVLSQPLKAAASSFNSDDSDTSAALKAMHKLKLVLDPIDGISHKVPSKQRAEQRSFYYQVPGYANVFVGDYITPGTPGTPGTPSSSPSEPNVYLTKVAELPIAQRGVVRSLPRLRAGGSIGLELTFDPATGALVVLDVDRKGADVAGSLSSADEAIGGLVDSIQAAREAAEDAELVKLQRKQAILEAQEAIQAAEDALDPNENL